MQLFYTDNIESAICELSEEESRHCVKVLRMGEGDTLHVSDGRGVMCRCVIVDAHPKHCTVHIEERIEGYGSRPYRLHLAVAPTKNTARMEWLVEKAVEMGVDEITPMVCHNSEREVLKRERLMRVAVSAMKQSLKATLPVINAPMSVAEVIGTPFDGQRFIAYCDGDHRTPLHEAYRGGNAQILIGPEGDFTGEEVRQALDAGCLPVTLGQYRLRTETAAMAALAFLNLMN